MIKGSVMLTLTEQKKRIETLLNSQPIQWQENQHSVYRILKPGTNKASLWLRITKGSETFTVATSGGLTSFMEQFIQELIGPPFKSEGNHRDWHKVPYEHVSKIVSEFSRVFSIKTKNHSTEQITNDIQEIIELTNIDSTEKSSLIQSRIGQGKFREGLLNLWGACSVTQSKHFPLLVASHIKPWSKSNNQERLDPYNGLLLLPNLDKAFDLGFISFDLSGNILISNELPDYKVLGISERMSILVKDKNKMYLKYHRLHIFKNTGVSTLSRT